MSKRGDELLMLGALLLLSGAVSGPKPPAPRSAPAPSGVLSKLPGWLPPIAVLRALGLL